MLGSSFKATLTKLLHSNRRLSEVNPLDLIIFRQSPLSKYVPIQANKEL